MFASGLFGQRQVTITPSQYSGVLVPKASVATVQTGAVNDLLNLPIFSDGMVSVDRIANARNGLPAALLASLTDAVGNAAEEHAKLPETERLRLQLEASAAQVWNDIARYNVDLKQSPEWASTPVATQAAKSLRQLWTTTNSSAAAVLQQFGIDKAAWYAAWTGRAATVDASLTLFESKVREAKLNADGEKTFAEDVANLSPAANERLMRGLEACERVGVGFRSTRSSYPHPGTTIIANLIHGDAVVWGSLQWSNSAGHPYALLNPTEPVKSLRHLAEIIQKHTKMDMSTLREPV